MPDWFFAETWRKHRGAPSTQRAARVVEAAEHQIGIHYKRNLEPDERRALREAVRGMARRTTLRDAYKNMFEWLGRPELVRPAGGKLACFMREG